MDPSDLREDFPGLKTTVNGHQLAYLDNAATTQSPRDVIETATNVLQLHGNPGRGPNTLSHQAQETVSESRQRTADFLGTESDEIVFTYNATDSINQLARSLCNENLDGANIVATDADHHANYLPWKEAAERTGATFRTVDVDEKGRIDIEDVRATVDTSTHILAFPHACNVTGQIFPVDDIVEAGSKATYTVLDAAQSIPHLPVDLGSLEIDFAAFSPHKMLGTPGLGVLYGRRKLLEDMEPARSGGGMVQDPHTRTYNDPPQRHEAGTINLPAIAGLEESIDYIEAIGRERIHEHTASLARNAYKRLTHIEGVKTVGPGPDTGTVSFTVDGIHPHDIASYLDQYGIQLRAGDHCSRPLIDALNVQGTVRMSFYLYNTEKDLETAIQTIEQAIEDLPHVQ